MIDRKIWKGDLLNLAAGNSFYGRDEVVSHRAGSCIAEETSEPGESLVEISGGYIVKRSDLYELSDAQCRAAHLLSTVLFAGLNQVPAAEQKAAFEELQSMGAVPLEEM